MKIWKIKFSCNGKESCKLVDSDKPADESIRIISSGITMQIPYKERDTEERILSGARSRKDAFLRRCSKK